MKVMRLAAIGSLLLALGGAWGCRPTDRRSGSEPTTAPGEQQPLDAIAQSDAQRAEAAIDRNQREMSGERRPFERPADRPVNQPRVGDSRR